MDYPLKTTEQLRQQLRALRKARGLTQAALGARIGVTQARVVEIEANPGAVSLQQILQVMQALGAGIVIRDQQPDAETDPQAAMQAGMKVDAGPRALPSGPARPTKKGSW